MLFQTVDIEVLYAKGKAPFEFLILYIHRRTYPGNLFKQPAEVIYIIKPDGEGGFGYIAISAQEQVLGFIYLDTVLVIYYSKSGYTLEKQPEM